MGVLRRFFLLIIILGFQLETEAQCLTQDSLALVDLYNSTNGENWFNDTNWFTECGTWTISNMRVDHNRLTYEDIEPSVLYFGNWYYPQDSVLETFDTTVTSGTDLILHSKVGGASNMYLWFRDGVPVLNTTATDSNLVLNNIILADSGIYTCTINNPLCPLLTLDRRPVRVHVQLPSSSSNLVGEASENPVVFYDPTNHQLEIIFNYPQPETIDISLLNMCGIVEKTVSKGIFGSENHRISLPKVSSGIYVVKISGDNLSWRRKIVIP